MCKLKNGSDRSGMLKDELVRPGVVRYAEDYMVRFGVVWYAKE